MRYNHTIINALSRLSPGTPLIILFCLLFATQVIFTAKTTQYLYGKRLERTSTAPSKDDFFQVLKKKDIEWILKEEEFLRDTLDMPRLDAQAIK